MNDNLTWIIDWNKINTIGDIKYILSSFDLRPIVDHPDFDGLKKYCKLIDEDGNEVNE